MAGEARYRLGPLALPGPGDPAEAGGSEAVALFADRARQADAHFALDGADRPGGGAAGDAAGRDAAGDRAGGGAGGGAGRDRSCWTGWMTGSRCWRRGPAGGRRGSGRWPRRWSGATSCWMRARAAGVPRGVGVPGAVHAGGRRGGRGGRAPGRRCCSWWTARCWSRRGPGRMAGPRYAMLETLRAYGAGLLAEAGEQDEAAAALAGYALGVAEQAAAGLQTSDGGAGRGALAGRRGRHHAAGAGLGHGPRPGHRAAAGGRAGPVVVPARPAGRPVPAAAPRSPGAPRRAATGGAPRSSGSAWAARSSADMAGALGHFTALRDAVAGPAGRPGRWPMPWPAGRRRCGNWAGSPRRPRMPAAPWPWPARLGYPAGEVLALVDLALAAAARRRPGRARCGWPGRPGRSRPTSPAWIARTCSIVLDRGADRRPATWPPPSVSARRRWPGPGTRATCGTWRDLLARMALLDLQAGRIQDAAAHLREALQLALRTGDLVRRDQ